MENNERRKEILNTCLDTFISKGLSETTVRDLSTALKLQSGGIYYWFKDKDEAVVACAEEAALRLENSLIFPALDDIRDPDRLMKQLKIRADKMRPTMKFFASVCVRWQNMKKECSQCWIVWRNVMNAMHSAFLKSCVAILMRSHHMCISLLQPLRTI